MMDAHQWDAATLRRVYAGLALWTNWWFAYRDLDGNGLPDYPIALDSGWDNSSLLEHGFHLESPDLAAFLVLQLQALARLARELGEGDAAVEWSTRADALLERLLTVLWTGDYFTVRRSHGERIADRPTSMLAVMPLVLGEHLPPAIFARLVDDLESRFLTAHGPATEALDSPLYVADGYWTGPIWAPSTCLLVDGLRRGGRGELADDIARRFCDTIQHIAGGNYENFDARTGQGLRAPGYSWTAAVNLVFLMEMAGTFGTARG
jgi:glycogen debranching enzyme